MALVSDCRLQFARLGECGMKQASVGHVTGQGVSGKRAAMQLVKKLRVDLWSGQYL